MLILLGAERAGWKMLEKIINGRREKEKSLFPCVMDRQRVRLPFSFFGLPLFRLSVVLAHSFFVFRHPSPEGSALKAL
jgi:hypothetical protein